MKPTGTYKIRYQRASSDGALRPPREGSRPRAIGEDLSDRIESTLRQVSVAERRAQRVVDSLCDEIRGGDERSTIRIRRVFSKPREIFRIELERPDLGYQRTTLLGREALEALLEVDDVRSAIEAVA
jgi:hypothetical protein